MSKSTKEEKLAYLHSLEKETDLHKILEEILPEFNFTDVKITHEKGNKPEFGKDLVCSKQDELEEKKDWIAFVVKKGVVSGSTGVIKDISDQVSECFHYPYKDVQSKGAPIPINKVKVVTNRHFSAGAKDKIYDGNKLDSANIDFWEDNKIIKLIDKYYPQFWYKGTKTYKKYAEYLENQIRIDNVARTLGIKDAKAEKILNLTVSPKLFEYVEEEDGSVIKKKREIKSVIELESNTLIIGQPGSGKSTIFKKLCKEVLAQNALRNDCDFYPIILTFNKLQKADFDIKKTLVDYFKEPWLNQLQIDVDELLMANECVIFIDALDEVSKPELKKKSLEEVVRFSQAYPKIRIVCSSRPADYMDDLTHDLEFNKLHVDELNKTQIRQFLQGFFNDDLIKSRRLLKSLQDSGILNKLPKTPLTISLISILFDENEVEIPATISDLYQSFVDLLIGRYTSENTTDILEVGIKHRLLCTLAKFLHTNHEIEIKRKDAEKLLSEYGKERGQKFDTSEMLEDLMHNTGILFLNDKDLIQFKHLSFQEYFTAFEYFHHRPKERDIFINNFNEVWWQNVALFYAGMSKDAPNLIEEILQASKPNTFGEYLTNTVGIGKLLQALYNTPIDKRKKGLIRSLENTTSALNFLIETNEVKYNFFKEFSKYGLMQLIGNWFRINHFSLTLHEPIKQVFDDKLKTLENGKNSEKEIFENEYLLHLIASILASPEYLDFEKSRQLLESYQSNDLSLIAMMKNDFRETGKRLSKEERQDENFAKMDKKFKSLFLSLGKISDKVNIKLSEKKE